MTEQTVSQSNTQRHLISLRPHASVQEAACVMTCANCGSVLIMDTVGTLLGIVTERDLMTHNPQCVGSDMKVAEAVEIAEFNDQVNDALG